LFQRVGIVDISAIVGVQVIDKYNH